MPRLALKGALMPLKLQEAVRDFLEEQDAAGKTVVEALQELLRVVMIHAVNFH